ncbi:MAG: ATP-binding protein [Maribacter sp.]|nr:ATP-binding protein [Maribacter sp.]
MNNHLRLKAKKIVITGGPSTGKTAVIEQLEKEGYYCLHEVIRSMTSEEKNQEVKLKIVSNPIVSVSNPKQFNLQILQARVEQFKTAQKARSEMVFFDRGIPDILAYMDCFKQTYDAIFSDACKNHRYDKIFLMPPWEEIHTTDKERYESFEESLQIHNCLKNSYVQHAYDVTTVPKGTINERIAFIIEQVNAS